MSKKEKVIEIIDFVKQNSYLIYDSESVEQILKHNLIIFSTRENGIISDEYEAPGEADIEEARRVRKLLKEKFPELKMEITYFDEWTMFNINTEEL